MMPLILTRKVDEEIIVNGNIRIQVASIREDRVRLLIDAPQDVPIVRRELLEDRDE